MLSDDDSLGVGMSGMPESIIELGSDLNMRLIHEK